MSNSVPSRTDDTELRRALWRYEHGHLSATRLRRRLRAAYARASRGFLELEAGIPAVRRHAPGLIAARDAFRARADDALRRERYRDALDEIFLGRQTLESMQALVAAAGRMDEAEAAVQRLQAHARVPRLRALPCVQAPADLLALARERMSRQGYARAAFLAAAAVAECQPLERRERGMQTREDALQSCIGALRTLCAETRALSAAGEADPAEDGSLDVTAALARDGWMALAERLSDELAFSLAARGRLYRELQRGGATSADDALLRGAMAAGTSEGDGWSSATAALWTSRVEAAVQRAQGQRDRLERTRAALDGTPST